jgi:hypothetical protein
VITDDERPLVLYRDKPVKRETREGGEDRR